MDISATGRRHGANKVLHQLPKLLLYLVMDSSLGRSEWGRYDVKIKHRRDCGWCCDKVKDQTDVREKHPACKKKVIGEWASST
jgi:glucose dehydrogenase